jgi:hypothetical protein
MPSARGPPGTRLTRHCPETRTDPRRTALLIPSPKKANSDRFFSATAETVVRHLILIKEL